jgi:hypothetical protein
MCQRLHTWPVSGFLLRVKLDNLRPKGSGVLGIGSSHPVNGLAVVRHGNQKDLHLF